MEVGVKNFKFSQTFLVPRGTAFSVKVSNFHNCENWDSLKEKNVSCQKTSHGSSYSEGVQELISFPVTLLYDLLQVI